ncbi:uncharacterized protein LOC135923576 isoform X2 [Gordionus sp. m RMFG-2023]
MKRDFILVIQQVINLLAYQSYHYPSQKATFKYIKKNCDIMVGESSTFEDNENITHVQITQMYKIYKFTISEYLKYIFYMKIQSPNMSYIELMISIFRGIFLKNKLNKIITQYETNVRYLKEKVFDLPDIDINKLDNLTISENTQKFYIQALRYNLIDNLAKLNILSQLNIQSSKTTNILHDLKSKFNINSRLLNEILAFRSNDASKNEIIKTISHERFLHKNDKQKLYINKNVTSEYSIEDQFFECNTIGRDSLYQDTSLMTYDEDESASLNEEMKNKMTLLNNELKLVLKLRMKFWQIRSALIGHSFSKNRKYKKSIILQFDHLKLHFDSLKYTEFSNTPTPSDNNIINLEHEMDDIILGLGITNSDEDEDSKSKECALPIYKTIELNAKKTKISKKHLDTSILKIKQTQPMADNAKVDEIIHPSCIFGDNSPFDFAKQIVAKVISDKELRKQISNSKYIESLGNISTSGQLIEEETFE